MPTGFLVNLGDGSLDAGDQLNTSTFSFTTDTVLGTGSITFSGSLGPRMRVNDYNMEGTYYEGTDGNVYFVPDVMPRR
ncbi:hypothetical protein, partial [Gilvimarinus algae]